MRSISQSLLAAQQSPGTPYVRLASVPAANIQARQFETNTIMGGYGPSGPSQGGICKDSLDPEVFYVAGRSSENAVSGYIAKLSKNDLSIVDDQYYTCREFLDICEAGNYLYAVGSVYGYECVIMKIDKSDLSVVAQTQYGDGTGADEWFTSCATDGTYVWAVGIDYPDAANSYVPLIVEFKCSDLSVNAAKFGDETGYGNTDGTFYGVCTDGTYVYAGGTRTTGANTSWLIARFDRGGLANGTSVYGDTTYKASCVLDLAVSGSDLYAVGYVNSSGGMVLKLDTDLTLVSSYQASPSASYDLMWLSNIYLYGSTVYTSGTVRATGTAYYYGYVALFNCDLSFDHQVHYYDNGTHYSEFTGMYVCAAGTYAFDHRQNAVSANVWKLDVACRITGNNSDYYAAAAAHTVASYSDSTTAGDMTWYDEAALSASTPSFTANASSTTQSAAGSIGEASGSVYTTNDRLLAVTTDEQPYGVNVTVTLSNYDEHFSTLDLRGANMYLGFGYSSDYSNLPQLIVREQRDISYQGVLYTELVLMSNWERLERSLAIGDSMGPAATTGTKTVREAIEGLLPPGMELAVDTSDTTEDSVVPDEAYASYTTVLTVIRSLIEHTQNLLKLRGDNIRMIERDIARLHMFPGTISGAFTKNETVTSTASGYTARFVYQSVASGSGYIVIEAEEDEDWSGETTITGDQSTETCSSIGTPEIFDYKYGGLAGDHPIFKHVRTQAILEANRVHCVDALPDTESTLHSYHGEANDTDDQTTEGIVTTIIADPSVASDAAALAKANARMAHIQAEANAGYIVVPLNCGQEIHDIIEVTDDRANCANVTGRVGRIIHRFYPGVYQSEIYFGGLVYWAAEHMPIENVIQDIAGASIRAAEGITRGPEGVIPRETVPTGSTGAGIRADVMATARAGVTFKLLQGATPELWEEWQRTGRAPDNMTYSQLQEYLRLIEEGKASMPVDPYSFDNLQLNPKASKKRRPKTYSLLQRIGRAIFPI